MLGLCVIWALLIFSLFGCGCYIYILPIYRRFRFGSGTEGTVRDREGDMAERGWRLPFPSLARPGTGAQPMVGIGIGIERRTQKGSSGLIRLRACLVEELHQLLVLVNL